MAKGRKPVKTKHAKAKTAPKKSVRKRTADGLWLGTGLCPEAQGDGLPCRGVEGECERCGRALPLAN
jgi:hypothetical protein